MNLLSLTHVVAVARFRDLTYQVVEGERIISIVVEKYGSSTQELTAFIRYNPGTATTRKELLYHTDTKFFIRSIIKTVVPAPFI